jgi:hypothetical protein
VQSAKPEELAGELKQSQEIGGVLVVADQQRTTLGQPRQCPFEDPALTPLGRFVWVMDRTLYLKLGTGPSL